MGTGEKAQLVELLPCKLKEQGAGQILSTEGKSQGWWYTSGVVHIWSPSTEEAETEGSLELTGQPA